MKSLADRIKTKRKEKRLTMEALGKLVGVSKSSVSQWESGLTKKMDGENLVTLANALGVNAYWLSTGKNPIYIDGEVISNKPATPEEPPLSNAQKKLNEDLKVLLTTDIEPMDMVMLQQMIGMMAAKYKDRAPEKPQKTSNNPLTEFTENVGGGRNEVTGATAD